MLLHYYSFSPTYRSVQDVSTFRHTVGGYDIENPKLFLCFLFQINNMNMPSFLFLKASNRRIVWQFVLHILLKYPSFLQVKKETSRFSFYSANDSQIQIIMQLRGNN